MGKLSLPARVMSVTCLIVLAAQAPATAASETFRWEINEPRGSSLMLEQGGDGPNGVIGSDVRTGTSFAGATGYTFPWVKPNTPPARPGHLVVLPDDDRLDPESGTYTVTIRLSTTKRFGNVLQKGQARAKGGMWKFQMPKGVMKCLFRGGDRKTRTATSVTPINDGTWHVISCVRTPTSVSMYVDGELRSRRNGPTGRISNSKPLTIGGKPDCDQVKVTCDYYVGKLDWVEVRRG